MEVSQMINLLSGWKEIAKELNVCEKTAIKYAKEKKLPVQRDPAGHPIIKKENLENWRLKK
jgi:hypothetical protein